MAYINASINPSATIIAARADVIKDVEHTFVKFDENGKFVRAEAGEAAMGVCIGCVEDDEELYTVQVKEMGFVRAGEKLIAGDALEVGSDGKAVKHTSGFIMGYCIKGAASGALATIQITKTGKGA